MVEIGFRISVVMVCIWGCIFTTFGFVVDVEFGLCGLCLLNCVSCASRLAA